MNESTHWPTHRHFCTRIPSCAGLVKHGFQLSGWTQHPSPPHFPTFDPRSFLLEGCTETLEHHAVTGALHLDLLVQNPEKAPGILSTSSSW